MWYCSNFMSPLSLRVFSAISLKRRHIRALLLFLCLVWHFRMITNINNFLQMLRTGFHFLLASWLQRSGLFTVWGRCVWWFTYCRHIYCIFCTVSFGGYNLWEYRMAHHHLQRSLTQMVIISIYRLWLTRWPGNWMSKVHGCGVDRNVGVDALRFLPHHPVYRFKRWMVMRKLSWHTCVFCASADDWPLLECVGRDGLWSAVYLERSFSSFK